MHVSFGDVHALTGASLGIAAGTVYGPPSPPGSTADQRPDRTLSARSLDRVSSLFAAAVLAHEGGWDELLLVAAPIVLIVGLLVVVKRRVDAQTRDGSAPTEDDAHPSG